MIKFDLTTGKIISCFYDNNNIALTGLTDVVFYIYRLSDLYFYDWNDSSFKASAWTDIDGTGIEVNATYAPGDYYITWIPPADGSYIVRASSATAANVDPKDIITVYSQIENDLKTMRKIETGRWKIVSNQMIIYDDDDITPLYTFDLKDSGGAATMIDPYERVPV